MATSEGLKSWTVAMKAKRVETRGLRMSLDSSDLCELPGLDDLGANMFDAASGYVPIPVLNHQTRIGNRIRILSGSLEKLGR